MIRLGLPRCVRCGGFARLLNVAATSVTGPIWLHVDRQPGTPGHWEGHDWVPGDWHDVQLEAERAPAAAATQVDVPAWALVEPPAWLDEPAW